MGSAEAINREAERIRALGGKPPLRRKPGATNLFLETDQRRLLFYEGGAFTDGVRRYTAKELWEIARADPSRLTPAAGLRPVFQDLVLPTAGFVVGPNELRYVAELSGVYARYGLAMPALFLRAFGVVVEPPVRRILEKYRLDPWAFVDEGEAAFLRAAEAWLAPFRAFRDRVEGLLQEASRLVEEAEALEPNLVRPLRRFRARVGGRRSGLGGSSSRPRRPGTRSSPATSGGLRSTSSPLGFPRSGSTPTPCTPCATGRP